MLFCLITPYWSPTRPPPSLASRSHCYFDHATPLRALHDHRHHLPSRINVIWIKPDHSYTTTAITFLPESRLFGPNQTIPTRSPPPLSFQNQRYFDQTSPFLHDHRHHFPSRINVILTKLDHSYTTTAITVFPESTLF